MIIFINMDNYLDKTLYGIKDIPNPHNVPGTPSEMDFNYALQAWLAGGDDDAYLQVLNERMQYLVGEQNYERSLPSNQSALMQRAGMSRAAALAALQGIQPNTAVNGLTTDMAGHDAQRWQNILGSINTGFNAIQTAVGAGTAIASTAYDMRVKKATVDMLSTQSTLLKEQREGQLLAAQAVQACANNGVDFDGLNASGLMEYMSGLPDYSSLVQSIRRNPYAFASLSNMLSSDYATKAASYTPEHSLYLAKQQRALAALAENDVNMIPFENTILANQEYRDSVATALYQAVEYAKANSLIKNFEFDAARFQNMLDNIKLFNRTDLAILNFQLQEALTYTDESYRQNLLDAITNSSRFQAAQALYGFSMTDAMQQRFNQEKQYNPNEFNDNVKKFFYGMELGGYQNSKNIQGWLGTAGTAIGGVAAACLVGFKIFGPKAIVPPGIYQGWTPNYSASLQTIY